MVFSGKPSSGCSRCKERRKKCDETRPECTNCRKLGQPCPGFPDQVDLLFKHETARITSKANGTSKRRRSWKSRRIADDSRESNTASSSSSERLDTGRWARNNITASEESNELRFVPKQDVQDRSDHIWPNVWYPSASLTFNPTIERQAVSFFFENFIVPSQSRKMSRGFLEVLAPMYEATAARSLLSMATEALAVRIAASFPGSRHLLCHADNLYGQALNSGRHALRDPKEATSDETLLSILLFSLYESLTTSDRENWSKHIRGAVGIARSRGIAQFSDPQSSLLFRATRTQMLGDAISRGEAIEDFPGPKGWLSDQEDAVGNHLIEYSIRIPDLLAGARELLVLDQTIDSIAKVNELLQDAYKLQHALFDWELNSRSESGYKSIYHSAPSGAVASEADTIRSEVWQPGLVHIYENLLMAIIRNNIRVLQLLCSSVVIDSLKWLDPVNYIADRRYKAAAYRVQYLVDDIAASVPVYLGYRLAGKEFPLQQSAEKAGTSSLE